MLILGGAFEQEGSGGGGDISLYDQIIHIGGMCLPPV